jgi:hypothetical protein
MVALDQLADHRLDPPPCLGQPAGRRGPGRLANRDGASLWVRNADVGL